MRWPSSRSALPSTYNKWSSSAPGNTHNRGSPVAHSFVFESVNVDQGDNKFNSIISRIISSTLDSIGSNSARTGNTANDIREMISERLARVSSDGGISDSTHPHPNPSNSQRGSRFSSATPLGPQNPAVYNLLETALVTLLLLSNFLAFFNDEKIPDTPGTLATNFLTFVLNLAFALSVLGFLIMHISLVLGNTTTIEAYEKRNSPMSKYNIGRRKNFEQVFGTDKRYWFIPSYSEEDLRRMPVLQGLNYPSRPDSIV